MILTCIGEWDLGRLHRYSGVFGRTDVVLTCREILGEISL